MSDDSRFTPGKIMAGLSSLLTSVSALEERAQSLGIELSILSASFSANLGPLIQVDNEIGPLFKGKEARVIDHMSYQIINVDFQGTIVQQFISKPIQKTGEKRIVLDG